MLLMSRKPQSNPNIHVWFIFIFRVYTFDDFLSAEECAGLMRVHDQHVQDSSKHDPILCFDSINTLRKHLKEAKKSKLKVTPKIFTTGMCARIKTYYYR
jgi:hypothetical protein